MLKDKLIKLSLILVLVGLTLWVCFTAFHIGSFKRETMVLGIDLQGGLHLVYEADFSNIPAEQQQTHLEESKRIIEERANSYGVAEPIIQIQGNNRISIQLPGIEDPAEAMALIGATAQLDFRKLAEQEADGKTTLTESVSEGDTILKVTDVTNFTVGESLGLRKILGYDQEGDPVTQNDSGLIEAIDTENNTITIKPEIKNSWSSSQEVQQWIPATGVIGDNTMQLVGEHLKSNAIVGYSTSQIQAQAIITFNLRGNGPELFKQITNELINKPLGIFLDNERVSSPNVEDEIAGGSGIISGLDLNEARVLAIQLNQGALPLELNIVAQQNVSSTLGDDSLRKSLIAGGIGLVLVLLFMMAYYRLPGVVASLALIIYTLVVLSIFKLFPVTLTLAGIAAFILSIGMAVDANVLIFERMKEEIRSGRTVGAAIEAGFDRAWSSIRDSNISTILTCIVLIIFGRTLGANVVTGFAITLLIGVIISMFTAIVITKTLLRMFIGTRIAKKLELFCSGSKGRHTND
ncbi:MAG: protein translocase subunit SecD [Chloroflexi bacterium]|jgi:preprotein translocase subunit SecD|nr:protein translocase subunit SecD [Chloroflexota bacterium]MBT7082451.1 protein translocase subunit SecD [Chloroflexota bacterium]MBT7290034.1 protein translocase subunit SecD [Chloroflexota bacterium]